MRSKIEENDFENKQLILEEIEEMKNSEKKMEEELRLRLESIKVQEQETILEYIKDLVSVLQLETKGEMDPEKLFR